MDNLRFISSDSAFFLLSPLFFIHSICRQSSVSDSTHLIWKSLASNAIHTLLLLAWITRFFPFRRPPFEFGRRQRQRLPNRICYAFHVRFEQFTPSAHGNCTIRIWTNKAHTALIVCECVWCVVTTNNAAIVIMNTSKPKMLNAFKVICYVRRRLRIHFKYTFRFNYIKINRNEKKKQKKAKKKKKRNREKAFTLNWYINNELCQTYMYMYKQ